MNPASDDPPSQAGAQLIAIDMDGTLLDANGRLTPRTAAAVRSAADAGHHLVLATGRPPHLVTDLADELAGAIRHIVATNGSIVASYPSEPTGQSEILHLLSFEIDRARRIIADLRAYRPGFGFAFATDAGFGHEPGFADRMPAAVHEPDIADVLALGGTAAFKLFAFHDEWTAHELLDVLPPVVNAEPTDEAFAVGHMGADAVEIGPASTDKCAGLRWLCAHLGVERGDVVAIGDERNDLTMIEWAGHGVAMANADRDVLAVADEVIGHHAAHGVAAYLEAFVKTPSRPS